MILSAKFCLLYMFGTAVMWTADHADCADYEDYADWYFFSLSQL